VTIAAPHPETDWRWGEESIRDVHWRDAGVEIVGQFLLGEEERGEPEAARDRASELLLELFDFKTQFVGAPPDAWTAKLVDSAEYPRRTSLDRRRSTLFPRSSTDSSRAESAAIGRSPARCASVARSRPAFLREARNPARFGPGPRMQADGVDLSDDDAVQRYRDLRARERRSVAAPRRALGEGSSAARPGSDARRAVPDPKAPVPAAAACPTGSAADHADLTQQPGGSGPPQNPAASTWLARQGVERDHEPDDETRRPARSRCRSGRPRRRRQGPRRERGPGKPEGDACQGEPQSDRRSTTTGARRPRSPCEFDLAGAHAHPARGSRTPRRRGIPLPRRTRRGSRWPGGRGRRWLGGGHRGHGARGRAGPVRRTPRIAAARCQGSLGAHRTFRTR
jgi:hypothetical protein